MFNDDSDFTDIFTLHPYSGVSPDSSGGASITYGGSSTFKGKIRLLKAIEKLRNSKINEDSSHRIYCNVIDIPLQSKITFDGFQYIVIYANDVMNEGELLQVDVYQNGTI